MSPAVGSYLAAEVVAGHHEVELVLAEAAQPAAALLPVPAVLGLPGVQQPVVVARLVKVLVVVVRARGREDAHEPENQTGTAT